MSIDLRRGPPLDMRTRLGLAALVTWCLAAGALLLVSVAGFPAGSGWGVAFSLLGGGGLLASLIALVLARATARVPDAPGAVFQDDADALVVVTELGVEPIGLGVFAYLLGMPLWVVGSMHFVNRAHVQDAILGTAIGQAVLAGLVVRAFGPVEVRVDGEGVMVARGGIVKVVRWSELREVGARRGGIELVRLDGTRVLLRGARLPRDERRRLVARIEAGIAAIAEPLPDRAALLERGGRPVSEWRSALGRLVDREGYRVRGLSLEEAEAVLAAERAPAERRIGAALALRAAGEPRAAERIRVAIGTCRDPKLRLALLEACAEEPAAEIIDGALRHLGDPR